MASVLIIIDSAVVEAGPPQTTCANLANVNLAGLVSGAVSTGYWSTSGSGTFTPDSSDLSAVYSASSADTSAGAVVQKPAAAGWMQHNSDRAIRSRDNDAWRADRTGVRLWAGYIRSAVQAACFICPWW